MMQHSTKVLSIQPVKEEAAHHSTHPQEKEFNGTSALFLNLSVQTKKEGTCLKHLPVKTPREFLQNLLRFEA